MLCATLCLESPSLAGMKYGGPDAVDTLDKSCSGDPRIHDRCQERNRF